MPRVLLKAALRAYVGGFGDRWCLDLFRKTARAPVRFGFDVHGQLEGIRLFGVTTCEASISRTLPLRDDGGANGRQ